MVFDITDNAVKQRVAATRFVAALERDYAPALRRRAHVRYGKCEREGLDGNMFLFESEILSFQHNI